jgi:hypothetical protein
MNRQASSTLRDHVQVPAHEDDKRSEFWKAYRKSSVICVRTVSKRIRLWDAIHQLLNIILKLGIYVSTLPYSV